MVSLVSGDCNTRSLHSQCTNSLINLSRRLEESDFVQRDLANSKSVQKDLSGR